MVIKGYSELALAELGPSAALGEEGGRALASVERGAERLTKLINALLDVSQAQLVRLKVRLLPLDFAQLVREAVSGVAVIAPRHRLHVTGSESAPILGDAMRLSQVVHNILGNGIKYSPAGGAVDVSLSVDAGRVVLAVRDAGVGIPEAKQSQIFQRFYQAHIDTAHDYGGMGVGLYLVREIVHLHGGAVWFESVASHGSTFFVSLPLRRSGGAG
jgi:signal transduction histidine kinase